MCDPACELHCSLLSRASTGYLAFNQYFYITLLKPLLYVFHNPPLRLSDEDSHPCASCSVLSAFQQVQGHKPLQLTPNDSQELAVTPFVLLRGKWQQSITTVSIELSLTGYKLAGIICFCPVAAVCQLCPLFRRGCRR